MDRLLFYIAHVDHGHDRTFAANLSDYFHSQGIESRTVVLNDLGQRPELRECLRPGAAGLIGFNSQLDHSWLESANILDVAARQGVPVIQWILDHPSSRMAEFNNSTAANARFLFSSANAEAYFRRYGIVGAPTATVACVGPSRHSRLDHLDFDGFARRPEGCLIAMNLRRIGGGLDEVRARIAALDPRLAGVVNEAVERAYLDVLQPLETHFDRALGAGAAELPCPARHACMQMLEEVVQILRRRRIFEVAREFPVLIQSDEASRPFRAGAAARFEENVDMALTWSRLKQARAQVSISNMHDMVHDRILNGLNAGCVNIVEDSSANRRVFAPGRNALFFNYGDDSLRECLSLVLGDARRAFEIAAAGFATRDAPPFRFGDFRNIVELAQRRAVSA